jgi:hypothetical protein
MIDKKKVANYLVQGVGTDAIAGALGCDASYISQLREDPEVLMLMEEESSTLTAQDVDFDARLANTEDAALKLIERNLAFANPHTALATFKVLNSANRRKAAIQQNTQTSVNVTLILPQAALPTYVTNERKEIIEVEGRTMLSATPRSIEALAEARTKSEKNIPKITAVEQAAARLSSLAPRPVAARKSPLEVFNPRTVTVDQL